MSYRESFLPRFNDVDPQSYECGHPYQRFEHLEFGCMLYTGNKLHRNNISPSPCTAVGFRFKTFYYSVARCIPGGAGVSSLPYMLFFPAIIVYPILTLFKKLVTTCYDVDGDVFQDAIISVHNNNRV